RTPTCTCAIASRLTATAASPTGTNAVTRPDAPPTAAGAYTFQVTVTDQGGLTATSSVMVTVTQTAASVTVAPPTANVHQNATQRSEARRVGQEGGPLASQPTFARTVSGGGTKHGAGQ